MLTLGLIGEVFGRGVGTDFLPGDAWDAPEERLLQFNYSWTVVLPWAMRMQGSCCDCSKLLWASLGSEQQPCQHPEQSCFTLGYLVLLLLQLS